VEIPAETNAVESQRTDSVLAGQIQLIRGADLLDGHFHHSQSDDLKVVGVFRAARGQAQNNLRLST
jgi:hypothetical protein